MRQIIFPLLAGVGAALAGIFVYQWLAPLPNTAISIENDNYAPAPVAQALSLNDFRLSGLDGQTHTLSDWQAPLLVINLWAPWCPPCRRELPALIELQRQNPSGIQVAGISFDSQQNVREFTENIDINYPLLLAGADQARINQFFGNSSGGLPFTAILNAKREIIYTHSGEITLEALQKALPRI